MTKKFFGREYDKIADAIGDALREIPIPESYTAPSGELPDTSLPWTHGPSRVVAIPPLLDSEHGPIPPPYLDFGLNNELSPARLWMTRASDGSFPATYPETLYWQGYEWINERDRLKAAARAVGQALSDLCVSRPQIDVTATVSAIRELRLTVSAIESAWGEVERWGDRGDGTGYAQHGESTQKFFGREYDKIDGLIVELRVSVDAIGEPEGCDAVDAPTIGVAYDEPPAMHGLMHHFFEGSVSGGPIFVRKQDALDPITGEPFQYDVVTSEVPSSGAFCIGVIVQMYLADAPFENDTPNDRPLDWSGAWYEESDAWEGTRPYGRWTRSMEWIVAAWQPIYAPLLAWLSDPPESVDNSAVVEQIETAKSAATALWNGWHNGTKKWRSR